jgi:hypothetical protein
MNWRQALIAPFKVFANVAFYALLSLFVGVAALVIGVKILAGTGWAFVIGGGLALIVGVWVLIGIARSGN